MVIQRGYQKTTYGDGRVVEFNPFVRWTFVRLDDGGMLGQIGVRGNYDLGFLWRMHRTFTIYRTLTIRIGRFAVFVQVGRQQDDQRNR